MNGLITHESTNLKQEEKLRLKKDKNLKKNKKSEQINL
jgi:hypothetical protein